MKLKRRNEKSGINAPLDCSDGSGIDIAKKTF